MSECSMSGVLGSLCALAVRMWVASEIIWGSLMARRIVISERVAATKRKEAKVADFGSTLMLYNDYLSCLLALFLMMVKYRRGFVLFLTDAA
jgi:hypothetical protein